MSDDVIDLSGPCKLKKYDNGYDNGVIGQDRKLKKS